MLLTVIDAALGHRQEAIADRGAADLLPSKRCYDGSGTIVKPCDYLRLGWRKGSRRQASRRDATVLRTYFLRSTALTSVWNPLGDNPRFEKIVEESKKPVTLN
jgi:hypothetical protein